MHDAPAGGWIGARLPRKEDARHLDGAGQFVADIQLPRTREVALRGGEIERRDAPSVMGGQNHLDLVIDIEPLRVVVELFGGQGHARHPAEGRVEIGENPRRPACDADRHSNA